jgi:hypothetical protein
MRPFLLGICATLALLSCTPKECNPLQGTYINEEGQKLEFAEGGKAQFITFFGTTASDTVFANMRYACNENPGLFDLIIDTIEQKALRNSFFGLLSWSGDSMFLVHMESGRNASVRPTAFSLDRAKRFKKVQN